MYMDSLEAALLKLGSSPFCSEDQRDAVLSRDRAKAIVGVPGSRKTDALVKDILVSVSTGKNHLVQTMISSVTDEIKRRIETLSGRTMTKHGSSHWCLEWNGAHIEVANIDAVVHSQLKRMSDKLDEDWLRDNGDCHEDKIHKLIMFLKSDAVDGLYLETGQKADVTAIDEFQDAAQSPAKTDLIIQQGHIMLKNGGRILVYGDVLQTLFLPQSANRDKLNIANLSKYNVLRRFCEEIEATVYMLPHCFRCPPSHVRLQNAVTAPIREMLGLSDVLPDPEWRGGGHRPLFFTHKNQGSHNNDALTIASDVVKMVEAIKEVDGGLAPKEVHVIMSKSNDQPVFNQCQQQLFELYKRWGLYSWPKRICTAGDDTEMRLPVDWNRIRDETVLLSIHSDKGKGNRVIIFPGFTDWALPRKSVVGTAEELAAISAVNVALSRSTDWLCLGFNYIAPSPYLKAIASNLHELGCCAWDPATWKSKDEAAVCRSIHTTQQPPKWNREKKKQDDASRPVPTVKAFARENSHVQHLTDEVVWHSPTVTHFRGGHGKCQESEDSLRMFWGNVGEMMVERELTLRRGSSYDVEYAHILLRDDVEWVWRTKVLNYVVDRGLNDKLNDAQEWAKVAQHWLEDVTRPHPVLPDAFKKHGVRKHVKRLQSDEPSENITESFWPVALAIQILKSKTRLPYLLYNFNHCHTDRRRAALATMLINVKKYVGGLSSDVEMQVPVKCGQFKGVCDMVSGDEVVEFKVSTTGTFPFCRPEWKVQTLMYVCMLRLSGRPVRRMKVVDIAKGCEYTWNVEAVGCVAVMKRAFDMMEVNSSTRERLIASLTAPRTPRAPAENG